MTVNEALGILHRNVRHRLSVAVEERTTLRPDGTTEIMYGIDTGFKRYFGTSLERCLHSAGLPTAPTIREAYDDAARWPERHIPVKVMELPSEQGGGDDVDLITETVQPACANGCRQKAG